MCPPQYCPHVLDFQKRKRAIANFTTKSQPSSKLETNRKSKKDIQNQIGKPKSWETALKSKTQHDDGGNGNPRFHETTRTTHRFVKNLEHKKDIQIQIGNQKY